MNILNKIKQILNIIFVETLREAKVNYLKLYSRDKNKALIILSSFIIFGILLIILSFTYLNNNSISQSFDSQGLKSQTENITNIYNILTIPNSGATEDTNVITQLLSDFVWPIFEDYIGNTPDPTGKSHCYTGSYTSCVFSNGNNDVKFAKSDTSLTSAQKYSSQLLAITGPIFVLLCIIQGFNFISNENREDIKKLITRFVLSIILLILTPYILSFSVILINLLTNAIMANGSISSSLNSVVESIINGVQGNEAAKSLIEGNILVYFLKGGALSQIFTFLCLAIPFCLVLLLLIYICFQFIIRFLNLYFLTAVYPFVIIFNVYPKTQSIVNSYFKQWTTFLIQQPVFILGFKIVIDMLVQLSEKGSNSLQYLIIFIGILLFLASINIFSAKIWGDVYTAVSQNVTAALGTTGLISAIKNPLIKNNPSKTNNSGSSNFNIFNVEKDGINTNPTISLGNNLPSVSQSDNSSASKKGTSSLNDNRSTITKTLDGAGYDVQSNSSGMTSVSGMFYTNNDSNNDLSTLYINKGDAINDGILPKNIQPIFLNNLNFLDTSNGKAANEYNNDVNKIAASSGVKAPNINIGQNSLDSKVFKSMTLAKNNNLKNNIQGIGIKNDLISGDRNNPIDNRIKIVAYKEIINNQINGTS